MYAVGEMSVGGPFSSILAGDQKCEAGDFSGSSFSDRHSWE